MPKVFISSNTLFGYKSHIGFSRFFDESEKYFNGELIPFLHKYAKPDDYFIILGGIFAGRQNINVKSTIFAQNIFEKISSILPLYLVVGEHDRYQNSNELNAISIFKNIKNVHVITSKDVIHNDKILISSYAKNIQSVIKGHSNIEYLFFTNDPSVVFSYKDVFNQYKKVYTGFSKENGIEGNIINVGSPYQTEPNTQAKGITVLDLDSGKDKFLPNGISTKFKKIHIETISQLENIDKSIFDNNFVDVIVSKELYENNEFRIKISEFDIQSLSYEESDIIEEIDTSVSDIFNVDELILSRIEHDEKLKEGFNNIVKIHNQEL